MENLCRMVVDSKMQRTDIQSFGES